MANHERTLSGKKVPVTKEKISSRPTDRDTLQRILIGRPTTDQQQINRSQQHTACPPGVLFARTGTLLQYITAVPSDNENYSRFGIVVVRVDAKNISL